MHVLMMILTALLLIPAALAGIVNGTSRLIGDWSALSAQLETLAQLAEPLWLLGQALLGVLFGLAALALAALLLTHALKS